MLIDTPIQEITVDNETYRYYIGNKFVSVEVDSIVLPKSGKTWFSSEIPSEKVGKAIAATRKKCDTQSA